MTPIKQLKLFLKTLDRKHLNAFRTTSICPLSKKDLQYGCWGCSWLSDDPNDYLEYDCGRWSMTCFPEALWETPRKARSVHELHIAVLELYAKLKAGSPRKIK